MWRTFRKMQVSGVTGSTFSVQILWEDYLVTVGYILKKKKTHEKGYHKKQKKKKSKDSAIICASE